MSLPKRRKSASRTQVGEALSGISAAYVQDQKPAGTDAGTPVEDAWSPRDLNTLLNPMSVSWITLGVNAFTLAAGKYLIRATAPFSNRDNTDNTARLRIMNVTDSTVAILGLTNQYTGLSGLDRSEQPEVSGALMISEAKTFQLQYYLKDDASNGAGYGLGSNFNIGGDVEIYSNVEIIRLGD